MSQPCPPELPRDPIGGNARRGAASDALSGLINGIVLSALGALDIALTMQFAEAISTVLAERDEPLVPVFAATGCAMTAGAALALSWLLIEDLAGAG